MTAFNSIVLWIDILGVLVLVWSHFVTTAGDDSWGDEI